MYLSFVYEFKMFYPVASSIYDGQNHGKCHYLYPCAAMFVVYYIVSGLVTETFEIQGGRA